MGWPQITLIVLVTLNFGIALARHGELKGKFHAGWALIDAGILIGLLYAGGFFS